MNKFFLILLAVVFCITFGVLIIKPHMHKQFSFSVIDYLIKFNTDGSVTTIKKTTTTQFKKEGEQ